MPARLHLEKIARSDTAPARWLALAHGMFGSGQNWRGIARKVNEARPEWGVILVDLRQHGKSAGGEPPHTIAACAEDVRAALAETTLAVDAIAGHSFGGKVMMAARALVRPRQTWVMDASPSARTDELTDQLSAPPFGGAARSGEAGPFGPRNGAIAVLALMERLPRAWPTRDAFVRAVVDGGFELVLANWLAMNVVADDAGGYVLRLDLVALRAMITDYCRTDLWPAVLAGAPGDVEVVVATKSSTVNGADRARLAAAPGHLHVHAVDTGHWLHLEAPATIVNLFVSHLP